MIRFDSDFLSFFLVLFFFFLEGREEDRCSNQISPEYSNCWQSICTITSIAIDGYRGSCIPSAHLVVVVAVGYSVRSILYSNPRFFLFLFPFNSILPPRPTCLLLRFNVLLFLFLFLKKKKKNQICTIASWTNYLEKEKKGTNEFLNLKEEGREREKRRNESFFFSLLLPVHTWRGFLCWAHGLRQSEERVKSDCASAKFRWEWPRRWRSERKKRNEGDIIKREER